MKKAFLALALLTAFCTSAWAQSFPDPCTSLAKATAPITQTASSRVLVGATARKNYICGLIITSSSTAETFSVIEGSGSTCATTPIALIGAPTAASGLTLAANTPLQAGNGGAAVAIASRTASDVCILQSGSNRISGVLIYVQQ